MHVDGHVPGYVDAIVACFPRDVLPKVVEVDQVEPPAWANLLDNFQKYFRKHNRWLIPF